MTCGALWNTISGELFHSGVLSEIDFMYSIKEPENKDAENFALYLLGWRATFTKYHYRDQRTA